MDRKLTKWNHIRAVLALPFMNTVIIPTVLLAAFRDASLSSGSAQQAIVSLIVAVPMLAIGLALVIRAVALFVRRGRGTLAPWDPTEVLITKSIYRYSRNPMKAGLFLVLISEALLLRSIALTIWAGSFIAVNVVYIRFSEEPGLRQRFGDEYAAYCRRVPRWLRLKPAHEAPIPARERLS